MAQIHLVQLDMAWEDKAANHRLVRDMADGLESVERGSLVVLPELFDVGFTLNAGAFADDVTGSDSETFAQTLATELGVWVQGALIRQSQGETRATNNAVVFDPQGDLVCRYEKIHPFSAGREPEAFRGGDGIATFEWNGLCVCPLICYDLRFPELWRLATVDAGAEMFTMGASWPAPRHMHWEQLLRARAIENQAYVAGVNRCGDDPYLSYVGGSRIVDPKGEILASASAEPGILTADIEAERVRSWRAEFRVLDDVHRSFLGSIPID